MANEKVDNYISPELIKSLKDLIQLNVAASKSVEQLINDALKLQETQKQLGKSNENASTKRKNLTAVEKESNRIRNEQLKIHAQLDQARSNAVRSLTKSRIELKKINDEVKESITGEKAAKEAIRKSNDERKKQEKILKDQKSAIASLDKQRQKALQQILKNQIAEKQEKKLINSTDGSYVSLSRQISVNIKRYKNLSAAQRNNAKVGKQLKATIVEQQKAIMRLDSEMLVNNRNVGNYASALKGIAGNLLGAFGVVGGVTALASVLRSSFATITQYSSQNSQLASVLGKTKEEIEDLIKSSQEYGRTTQFTATQVAQLQTELAKLGLTQNEITDSTEAVLNLAAATGADLADAARVSGAALRAMGLEASEMDRVASVLAVSTTKTALSFQDFDGNLSTILPVAKSFNFSIEDSVALFGKLRDAGFDASSAATATRNILLNLADVNGKLAKQIGGAVGNFDEMIDALIDLDSQGLRLGETLELTDKRSVAAFNQFLRGAEDARTLRDGITDVNDELQIMVETRTANAEGAMKRLGSAWDGVVLKFLESDGVFQRAFDNLADNINFIVNGVDRVERGFENTTKTLRETTGSAEEYAAAIDLAIDNQEELVKQLQQDLQTERAKIFGDPGETLKTLTEQGRILAKLREEQITARNAAEAEGLAKRFDIENKSIEDLIKLQTSFSSFTAGEAKRNADLILPLIEEQIKKREELEKEANQKRAQENRDAEKENTEITKAEAKRRADAVAGFEKILTDAEARENKERLDENKKFEEDLTAQVAQGAANRIFLNKQEADERKAIDKALADAKIDFAKEALDAIFELSSLNREADLERLDKEREEDLERAELQSNEDLVSNQEKLAAGLITEEEAAAEEARINRDLANEQARINDEADRREAALKTKQARADKAAALIQIAINTALGVADANKKVITQPLIPFIIAQGAIQAAIVAAQPIPKFWTGTESSPSDFIAGDRGRELMITSSGDVMLTPDKPTLYSNMEGTKIIPNAPTEKILRGEKAKELNDKRIVKGLRRVEKAVGNSSKRVDNTIMTQKGNTRVKKHLAWSNDLTR